MFRIRFQFFTWPYMLILLLSTWSSTLCASTISTSLTTSEFSVGDLINFTVLATVPGGSTVIAPAVETNFGTVTVKEWNRRKVECDQHDSLFYDYRITTYIPEPCTIPALKFIVQQEQAADTISTDPVPLNIVSVLPNDTVDLIGLKEPLSAGKAPRFWLWFIVISFAVTAIAIVTTLLIRHLKKAPPPPPPVPPYEEAVDALNGLGVKKYLERGLVREYVFELSDIFKRYIARRFTCNATDFTTEEMNAWSSAAALLKTQRSSIEWFFRTTDPVKFARALPDADTITRFDREVRMFLEATRPIEETVPENTDTESTPAPNDTTDVDSSETATLAGTQ